MIEVKPTNIKPDAWYNEYYDDLVKDDDDLIDWIKERDKSIEIEDPYFDYDYGERQVILNHNTLEKNAKYLEISIAHHNYLRNKRTYKQIFSLNDLKFYFGDNERYFKLCKQAIKNGFLITNQLLTINTTLNNTKRDYLITKKQIYSQTFSNDFFNQFSFTDKQIFDLIRKTARWHDVERDIKIFQEKRKGKYLQELADEHGVDYTNISKIVKKVQGDVNYYKGKLFEDFIEEILIHSRLFKKVVKEAGKGECDISAYLKGDKKLIIYSLKNIKIDREPYWLVVEELNPEIKRARLQSFDYKINAILLIFDNHTNQIKQFKIDYNNPVNIDISK